MVHIIQSPVGDSTNEAYLQVAAEDLELAIAGVIAKCFPGLLARVSSQPQSGALRLVVDIRPATAEAALHYPRLLNAGRVAIRTTEARLRDPVVMEAITNLGSLIR